MHNEQARRYWYRLSFWVDWKINGESEMKTITELKKENDELVKKIDKIKQLTRLEKDNISLKKTLRSLTK